MEKLRIKQAIVVEGRYDKNSVAQVFDTIIIETNGFSVFNDESKRAYIKKIAEEKGIIVLTDSDSAGMLIRNSIKSFVNEKYLINAYVPMVEGKEKRKDKPSKEGLLGVEGFSSETIRKAVLSAATVIDGHYGCITSSDLYGLGYIGRENSCARRKELLTELGLPNNINNKDLLKYINSNEEVQKWLFKNQEKCTLKQF